MGFEESEAEANIEAEQGSLDEGLWGEKRRPKPTARIEVDAGLWDETLDDIVERAGGIAERSSVPGAKRCPKAPTASVASAEPSSVALISSPTCSASSSSASNAAGSSTAIQPSASARRARPASSGAAPASTPRGRSQPLRGGGMGVIG